MIPNPQILLVSPSAHYPSHYWPCTVALLQALRQKGRRVRAVIFSTGTEPIPPDLQGCVESVFSRTPLLSRPLAAGRSRHPRLARWILAWETLACLFKALKLARGCPNTTLHFLGGSQWVVMLAVRRCQQLRFVYSLYSILLPCRGTGMKGRLRRYSEKLLQRAVATGRIEFIGENELVREGSATLLGSRVHVILHAIDDGEALPSREEARRRLDLPPQEKIVLFFGTHRREKDYHTPLKGCLALANPPLALFVGKVISANDPRQVVADCHYPKARVVDEFIPEEMVKYYFAAADAVVLPYEENFSRGSGVLIDCCRHLRPMIASATPYFSAFLSRYHCGVTYASGNSASFADALGRLLADSAGCRAALEQARHDHSWTVLVDQYIQLYDGIIN